MGLGKIMKQAQKMQAKMAEMQERLKDEELESSAGGGTVKVTITGDLQIKAILIDPSAVDPDDVELLQDMTTAAVNEAIRSAQELQERRMAEISGGMNLPGLM